MYWHDLDYQVDRWFHPRQLSSSLQRQQGVSEKVTVRTFERAQRLRRTVTCRMPGPAHARFSESADMLDTDVGQAGGMTLRMSQRSASTLLNGAGDVVAGWKNKFQAAMANVTPVSVLAAQHAKMAAPGMGKN